MHALQILKTVAGAIARPLRWVIPAGLLDNTTFDRIRLLCVGLMIVMPLFAVVAWQTQKTRDEIQLRGITTEATVTRTNVIRLKGTSYEIDILWRDARGAQRRVHRMSVSVGYYSQLTRTTLPKVRIKYLADRETSRGMVALLDDPAAPSGGADRIPDLIGVTLFGFASTVLMTLWRNRRRRGTAQVA
jgi:hypothetical protein